MSDTVDIVPCIKCNRCGNTFKVIKGGAFVTLECEKCGALMSYTESDFNTLIRVMHESEAREKEREKHYER